MSVAASVENKSFQAIQYYNHKYYVNVYYAMYKALEKWLTEKIFRNDPSRVFLASDDYAYRRRFELTDTSKDFDTLEFSSLRFPFANYWPQNVGWVPDDRVAAKQAALTYVGIYVGNTKVKAAAGILPIDVTLWFDREDDARLAYDILYFHSFNEHYYGTKVSYGIDTTESSLYSPILEIPANIELTSLKFNPEFKEADWLQKQRVFSIKCTFEMRSYVIAPPKQSDYDKDDFADYDYSDNFDFYYIVDDVILNLSNNGLDFKTYDAGFDPTTQTCKGSTEFPQEGELGTVYVDDYLDFEYYETNDTRVKKDKIYFEYGKNRKYTVYETKDGDNPKELGLYERSIKNSLNLYIWNKTEQKYEVPNTTLDSFHVREHGRVDLESIDITKLDFLTNVKAKSNLIEWSYGPNTKLEDIEKIELHLTGFNDIIDIDPEVTSYKLSKLSSNSHYHGYIVFYTKNGSSKRFVINFITSKAKSDTSDAASSLIGLTW